MTITLVAVTHLGARGAQSLLTPTSCTLSTACWPQRASRRSIAGRRGRRYRARGGLTGDAKFPSGVLGRRSPSAKLPACELLSSLIPWICPRCARWWMTSRKSAPCDLLRGDVVGRGPHPNETVELSAASRFRRCRATGRGRSAWIRADGRGLGVERGGGRGRRLDAVDRRDTDRRASVVAAPAPEDPARGPGRSIGQLLHGSPLRQNEYLWSDRPSRVLARLASDEGDDLSASGIRTRPSTASSARRTSSPAARSGAGPKATRGRATP